MKKLLVLLCVLATLMGCSVPTQEATNGKAGERTILNWAAINTGASYYVKYLGSQWSGLGAFEYDYYLVVNYGWILNGTTKTFVVNSGVALIYDTTGLSSSYNPMVSPETLVGDASFTITAKMYSNQVVTNAIWTKNNVSWAACQSAPYANVEANSVLSLKVAFSSPSLGSNVSALLGPGYHDQNTTVVFDLPVPTTPPTPVVPTTSISSIPLVLVLFPHTGFSGSRIFVVENEATLDARGFNDVASSAIVYPGPSYESYRAAHNNEEPTVTLYNNTDRTGPAVKLKVGAYSDFTPLGVNDYASMVDFNSLNALPVATPTGTSDLSYSTINTVVETYTNTAFGGTKQVYVGTGVTASNVDCNTVNYVFNNDAISALAVKNGPNGNGNQSVIFGRDSFPNLGQTLSLPVGVYSNLTSVGFNDFISAIKLN